ncbi:MAG: ATP-dependent DNA helicase RecG [Bacteroidia bacterium]|nr:ATP-dependent DNA helicase RecG [Bacteroidia bacterium]
MKLDTPIAYLKGVGPRKADVLKTEAGIHTFADLLEYYPYRHVDRTRFYTIRELSEDLPYVQLRVRVKEVEMVEKGRMKRLVARVVDPTGQMELVWFQGIKWMKDVIRPGADYIVFGKVTSFKGVYNMAHPELEPLSEKSVHNALGLHPMYNSTEKMKSAFLDSKGMGQLIGLLFQNLSEPIPETLPSYVTQIMKMLSKADSLRAIHKPRSTEELAKAEFRLKFEELFYVRLRLLMQNRVRKNTWKGYPFAQVGELFNTFYNHHLPFQLTNAQKRVIKEVRFDTSTGKHMNRLIQGDVGSGKTIVALMAMLLAADNGFQACLMAPTEILAQQHHRGLQELLEPMGIEIGLLTGSTKQSERKRLHEALQNGSLRFLVGTHAIIEPAVKFANLGLAVIDEQHRFGVAQRARIYTKNLQPPHILVMTATPIPRTLAMTLYGELDVSVIDELPPGRKPVITRHMYDNRRLEMFGFLRQEIEKGRQAYIVYPLIEESEKLDLKHLEDGYESIKRQFPEYKLSIVHGRMTASAKEFEMQQFLQKKTQIMIATTVIEVGVNVPNASIMVIENAERFGLSQLHQLRGRVGRGADQSFCILMTDYKLSEEGRTRMQTMVRTNDGFEIAEVDLQLRGPGDTEGTRQSGMLDLKLADLAKDQKILGLANDIAEKILEKDPALNASENQVLKVELHRRSTGRTMWSKIS